MTKTNGVGYTIVELLIVMAVTSVIAVSAFMLVRGQQARNEFTQSVRDLEQKLSDIANDVANGYFPAGASNAQCIASDSAAVGLQFVPGTTGQGGNEDCIFAGKAVEVNPSGSPERVRILTLASRKVSATTGLPVTGLEDLRDNDLAITENGNANQIAMDEYVSLLHGLRIRSINGNTTRPSTIVFLSGFGSRAANSSSFTGSPGTDIYTVTSTTAGQSEALLRSRIRDTSTTNYQSPDEDGISICVTQGSQFARIILGRDGRNLTTTSELGITC